MRTSRYGSDLTPILEGGGAGMHAVLVSGWGKADVLWSPYRRWFEQEGFSTSIVHTRYKNFGPIQASAKALARHINELKHPPLLVGHSCGGLVIRYYMAHYYPQSQTPVSGVVSIGSPLSGSWLARLAPWSSSACQMVPESPFLRKFDSYPEPEVPWLSVKCRYDLIVPGQSSVLPVEDADVLEVGHTHVSALLSHLVFREIFNFALEAVDFDLVPSDFDEPVLDEEDPDD